MKEMKNQKLLEFSLAPKKHIKKVEEKISQ